MEENSPGKSLQKPYKHSNRRKSSAKNKSLRQPMKFPLSQRQLDEELRMQELGLQMLLRSSSFPDNSSFLTPPECQELQDPYCGRLPLVQPSTPSPNQGSRRCSKISTEVGDLPMIKCSSSPPKEFAFQATGRSEQNEADCDISAVAAELKKMTSNIEQKLKQNKRQQMATAVLPIKNKTKQEQPPSGRYFRRNSSHDSRPASRKADNELKPPNSCRTPEELVAKMLKVTPVLIDSVHDSRLKRMLWGCSIAGLKPEKKKWRCQDHCLLDPDFDGPVGGGGGGGGPVSSNSSAASLNSSRVGAWEKQVLAAVFDGHGTSGREVSNHCADQLPGLLRGHYYRRDPANALRKAFVKLHRALFATGDLDAEYSGTTATCCLLLGRRLHVAHVGDSRAYLIRYREPSPNSGIASRHHRRRRPLPSPYQLVELTLDHNATDPQEHRRIMKEGGFVLPNPLETKRPAMDAIPHRVWKNPEMMGGPGLAMSRSLGDNVAHTLGVSAEPDISTHDLDPTQDILIIIGSDGIWDVLDKKEIIQVVTKNFKDKKGNIRSLAHELCQNAYRKWISTMMRSDDITVAILSIPDILGKGTNEITSARDKKWNTNTRVSKSKLKLDLFR